MARFIGRLRGGRGEVSRLGTPASGIEVVASGWNVGVKVRAVDEDGQDVFFVYATSGSNNRASSVPVAVVHLGKFGVVVQESHEQYNARRERAAKQTK